MTPGPPDAGAAAGSAWAEAGRLFDEALELPAAERTGWLERQCGGNLELRAQVERLLAADAAASPGFMEVDGLRLADLPPAAEPEVGPGERYPAGSAIGPWRIVRRLARGGMGVVYLAERAGAVPGERAALKLIRRGLDSERIHRRFLAERQILARLDHPRIARLLDGGMTDGGEPWFAIEYVEGTTVVAHCRAHGLGVAARLRLFLGVCEAVEYAHRHRVIHRDLKPGNILVTRNGETKLLDFGIAKVVSGEGEPDPEVTRTADRILTPEYAAPEQLTGDPVTPATDVYALGAVLYELLTGRRAQPVPRRTPTEVVKAVILTRPERPSAVAPEGARAEIAGELDAIVLKALEKAPERRYQTVASLAGDIARRLDRD